MADLESRLRGTTRALNTIKDKLTPMQEYLDSTQSMVRELQVSELARLPGLQLSGLPAGKAPLHQRLLWQPYLNTRPGTSSAVACWTREVVVAEW